MPASPTRRVRRFLAPCAKAEWVVYAKEPFGGPEEVLRYLSRYTHRVAISNRRLVSADDAGVTFKCKDYRIDGPGRYTTMTLHPHEFIRRFLMSPKAEPVPIALTPLTMMPSSVISTMRSAGDAPRAPGSDRSACGSTKCGAQTRSLSIAMTAWLAKLWINSR